MALPAAFACCLFIAWLLTSEYRCRGTLSSATWIPTLLFFLVASRPPSQWLPAAISTPLVDEICFAGLTAASVCVLATRGVRWNEVFRRNAAVVLFYAYFAVTCLWSPDPAGSALRLFKDFASTALVGLVILSEKRPLEAMRAVYMRCACFAIPLSLYFTQYYQFGKSYDKAGGLMYKGVAQQKNSFGEMLMVFIVFLVWDHLQSRSARGKWPWSGMRLHRALLLLISAWLLYLSQSQTSIVCTLIAVALIAGGRRLASPGVSTVIFTMALSLPILLLATEVVGSVASPLLDILGRDATFSGRVIVWREIGRAAVNPLIGTGFYNFWSEAGGKAISEATDVTAINAHDGYLDTYLDGGVLGLGVLSVLLVSSARRMIRALPYSFLHRVRFAVLIVIIVTNVSESIFGRLSALWFTAVLMFLEYPFAPPAREVATHR